MTLFHRIRSSFTTQLTLWVAGFVIVIYGVVIFLLVRFSQQVVIDETIETTMQALENTALRIDNTLRQAEMTAFLEHRTFAVDQKLVERLIKENRYFESFIQSLSHAQLVVSADNDGPLSSYIVEADERKSAFIPCRFTSEGFIKLSVSKNETHVQFAIADTGMGIPVDKRDTIFVPFTKLDSFSEGVGLGLSYCKFAVDQLHGEIMLAPHYSPGSRFVVSLPITS